MPVILQKIMTQTWKQNDCKQDGENVFPFTRLKFKTLQVGESIIQNKFFYFKKFEVFVELTKASVWYVSKKKEKRKFSEKHCHWAWGEKHCQWASDSCIIAPLHCIALHWQRGHSKNQCADRLWRNQLAFNGRPRFSFGILKSRI